MATRGICKSKFHLRAQPEGSLPPLLQQVVGKTDGTRAVGEDDHYQAVPRLVSEDEVRDEGRYQDEHPAHRRRPLFGAVALGPGFPDVLSDTALLQPADEARSRQHGDDQRDQRCCKDLDHSLCPDLALAPAPASPASAAHLPARACSAMLLTITSSLMPREALKSTTSPGRSEAATGDVSSGEGTCPAPLGPPLMVSGASTTWRAARNPSAVDSGELPHSPQELRPRQLPRTLRSAGGRAPLGPELSHVSQHGDGPASQARRHPDQIVDGRPHRRRIRVVGVVDQAKPGKLDHLATALRRAGVEETRKAPLHRQPGGVAGGRRGDEVLQGMARDRWDLKTRFPARPPDPHSLNAVAFLGSDGRLGRRRTRWRTVGRPPPRNARRAGRPRARQGSSGSHTSGTTATPPGRRPCTSSALA